MRSENIIMAYAAGIIDGHGSFSIIKQKTKANPVYYALLQVNSWRKVIIHFLKAEFGGSVSTIAPFAKKDGSNGHPLYRWRIQSRKDVQSVLEKVMPYLKMKSNRARLLLRFIGETTVVRGKALSDDELILRERFYVDMIQSNDWMSFDNTLTAKLSKVISEDQVFWSYVAGLIDTDGSLVIKRKLHKKGTFFKNPQYSPVTSIYTAETASINYIRQNFPLGRLHISKSEFYSGSGFLYRYGIYNRKECAEFLKRIIPFLRAKKEHAEILLNFCENSVNTASCQDGTLSRELEFRHDCYVKLVNLNRYGVSKSPLMDLKPLPDNAEGNKAEGSNATVNAVSGETIDDDGCGTLDSMET